VLTRSRCARFVTLHAIPSAKWCWRHGDVECSIEAIAPISIASFPAACLPVRSYLAALTEHGLARQHADRRTLIRTYLYAYIARGPPMPGLTGNDRRCHAGAARADRVLDRRSPGPAISSARIHLSRHQSAADPYRLGQAPEARKRSPRRPIWPATTNGTPHGRALRAPSRPPAHQAGPPG